MATYTTLRQGNSNTSENKKLQQALKDAGYGSYLGSAGVDGIYGSGTAAAVTAYQRDNGLAVDGIAGNQTLGHLYGNTSTNAATSTNTTQTPAVTWQAYKQPDNVKQAGALRDQHYARQPGDFTYADQSLLDEYKDAWLNRGGFSYDLNSDPMYQQYKDMYTQQGQLAMLDTMGQAAALTGGYGSSYGQSVGQQAYQSYLQQLNDVVPELYGQAWNRYQAEGEELYNRYAALNTERQQAYGEHQDRYSNWLNMLNYLDSNYQYLDQTAYGQHVDDYNAKYGEYRDMIADQQYQEQFAYQKEQDAIEESWRQKEFDEAQRINNANLAISQEELRMAQQAAAASGLSTEEYNSIWAKAETAAKTGQSRLDSYLLGLVENNSISEELAKHILLSFFPTALDDEDTSPKVEIDPASTGFYVGRF